MIIRITIGYGANELVVSKGRDAYLRFREVLKGIYDLYDWPEDKDKPAYVHFGGTDLLVTEKELQLLHEFSIPYEIKNFRHGYWDSKPNKEDALTGNITNIHIAIPNVGLLMIDEVTWREDYCTQSLQSDLDDGWRILAVCPPNGDRRPTYILGRNKP